MTSNSTAEDVCSGRPLDPLACVLIGTFSFTTLLFGLLAVLCLRRYRSMVQTIRELRGGKLLLDAVPQLEAPIRPVRLQAMQEEEEEEEVPLPQIALQQSSTVRSSSRRLWKGLQQDPRFTKSDLNLLQLIKAGKEGVFYQARMSRGTCKGHNMFTCKISKEEPYILIMEYVSYGTLRTFLQTNRAHLSADPELPSLFTIASYHIALAMQHLRSKMIVHCDLALRNVMVSRFPWDVKVGEFGLARDFTRRTSRRSNYWRNPRQRVPLRWYPPEYFKSNYYSFKGDVWAFGIVLWEMQTFGTLPYSSLETSEAVVYHICIGHKNPNPEGCRPEMLLIMRDCWQEPYTLRPSFTNIVSMLENIIENDADYVDVESPQHLVKDEAEYHEAKYLRAASVTLEDQNPI